MVSFSFSLLLVVFSLLFHYTRVESLFLDLFALALTSWLDSHGHYTLSNLLHGFGVLLDNLGFQWFCSHRLPDIGRTGLHIFKHFALNTRTSGKWFIEIVLGTGKTKTTCVVPFGEEVSGNHVFLLIVPSCGEE